MKPVTPIQTLNLFGPLSAELLAVLRGCRPQDWARSTACPSWTVKDIAAHLLGGNLGRLWSTADRVASRAEPATSFDELVAFTDRTNDESVSGARRISPAMLIDLLELTDARLLEHFGGLDPNAQAQVPVVWAGQDRSPTWFDVAREYTEKWHHQQHIREALGKPLLIGRKWLHPVLDTFMRGTPGLYDGVEAADGTRVAIRITGDAGGEWCLRRRGTSWRLFKGHESRADATVTLDQDVAWRLFTMGADLEAASCIARVEGNGDLGAKVLELVAIMA